jgi:2-C-methyl-D-erythritol 4-phosphate cytidylyltransferase
MAIALIVAAGRGVRMGADRPKQLLELAGIPILAHVVAAFERAASIERIVLSVPAGERERCRQAAVGRMGPRKPIALVDGGAERQASVYNGLMAMTEAGDDEVVAIHDGVRPFIDPDLIDRCVAAARCHGSCLPVVAVAETVKRVDDQGIVVASADRRRLRLAQTPQAFQLGLIRRAHQNARRRRLSATDDAALVEALGERVPTIAGHRFNIKITTPEDLALAQGILAAGLWAPLIPGNRGSTV